MSLRILTQWLKTKFQTPRSVLEASMVCIGSLCMVFAWYLPYSWDQVEKTERQFEYDAKTSGVAAGAELALRDIEDGVPRHLRLELVDAGAGESVFFEDSGEFENGLPVRAWRISTEGRTTLFAEQFVLGYNAVIEGWRNRQTR